ncbi:hypothetical protein QJS04_geneDACA024349 [Acorus gramineus]|uniref:Methyltransferase type 11 domain-containing protein n=1 Tax=Acorus gramineus TaxID=55184 RepID=A0AAV9A0N4_ACOGR|nr:hypothetical protein QJS04_geneDACA024349 [Acorus gramineus]
MMLAQITFTRILLGSLGCFSVGQLGCWQISYLQGLWEAGSIDAVHAGAALHCWPSPSAAVAEISRVLRPGGVFVATTAIFDGIFSWIPLVRTLRQTLASVSGNKFYLSEAELKDLCKACGLVDFICQRNGPFVILSATKHN